MQQLSYQIRGKKSIIKIDFLRIFRVFWKAKAPSLPKIIVYRCKFFPPPMLGKGRSEEKNAERAWENADEARSKAEWAQSKRKGRMRARKTHDLFFSKKRPESLVSQRAPSVICPPDDGQPTAVCPSFVRIDKYSTVQVSTVQVRSG